MRSRQKALVRKVAFVISGLGFVLYFVAYLLPYWSRYQQPGTSIHFRYGLFLTCIRDAFKSTCNFIHLTVIYGSWVRVVQGVGGVALAFYFGSLATCFLAFYWKGRCKKTLLYVAASCGFAAGIFIAVTVFLYANSNEAQQDSLDFGFYFAIVSIVPILIGGILHVFNGKQVIIPTHAYTEKKKKKRMDMVREHIIEAMLNPDQDLKSHPPMSTLITNDTMKDMYDDVPDDDGARPGPSTDLGFTSAYSTDYETDAEVDNMMDMLDDEEGRSEEDFMESDDEGFGSQEKVEMEDKHEASYAEEILRQKERVVVEERKSVQQEEPPRSEVRKETKTRPHGHQCGWKSASLARQRLAHKQTKIAIMKVDCGKCPWEHTMMKYADDLTELDLPNVVKYIEGAENVAAYMLGIGREESIMQQYHPLSYDFQAAQEKEREQKRLERKLEEEKRRKMELKQRKEFEKIKSALKIKKKDEDEKERSLTIESSEKAVLPPIETSDRSSSRSSSEMSMSIMDDDRSPTKSLTMSTARLQEERERQKAIDEKLDKLMYEFNKSSRTSFTSAKSGKSRSREHSSKTLPGIVKPYPLETYAENETIIEDTFEGPGLSDDEDVDETFKPPLKSAFRDRSSAATHATGMTYATGHTEVSRRTTKASARTYASSNATTLLPRPMTVVFKGLHDTEPRPKEQEKPKPRTKKRGRGKAPATAPSTAYSRTGKSNKSATATKQRRSKKEHRIAIVKGDCGQCPWEKKIVKYEADLTEDERSKVERIFDRSIENVNESDLV